MTMPEHEPMTAEEERAVREAGAAWCGEGTFERLFATLDAERALRVAAEKAIADMLPADVMRTLEYDRDTARHQRDALRNHVNSCASNMGYGGALSTRDRKLVDDLMRGPGMAEWYAQVAEDDAERLKLEARVADAERERDESADVLAAARWAIGYIADGTDPEQGETPPHGCEFTTNPGRGACDFHAAYFKARAAIDRLDGGGR